MRKLTKDQARRIALGAQGVLGGRPDGRVDRRHFRRVLNQLGAVQLDSVNVLCRSHYLPFFSRLGSYSLHGLDEYLATTREVFEYWGHEASVMPIASYPLFRHRMEEMNPWSRARDLLEKRPGYVDAVHRQVLLDGPITVSELDDPGERTGPWWGYGQGKTALEWLFASGDVAATRGRNFVRLYDNPDRMYRKEIRSEIGVTREQAYRRLLVAAARHHGVGTAGDLADYFRLHVPTARGVIDSLVAEGSLEEVSVGGWSQRAFMSVDATRPRRLEGRALLSPFDSLVWNRDRTERLFDFRYRIEIYVPRDKRRWGYYVLPFLLDGRLVARVDLKSFRDVRSLGVRSVHLEEGVDAASVLSSLAEELTEMGEWLGHSRVEILAVGTMARELARLL